MIIYNEMKKLFQLLVSLVLVSHVLGYSMLTSFVKNLLMVRCWSLSKVWYNVESGYLHGLWTVPARVN
jgi:hypothetical protein